MRQPLVQNGELVLQDRNFSMGPAVFVHLFDYLEVEGDVVQTHISSPRATAYMACLLKNIDRVKNLIVFGAGNRLNEYKQYFANLGVDNIRIYAENFVDISVTSVITENTVGVLATPPCSYSGINDPIDLICSRGGDLAMLEILSESEMTDEGKQRVGLLLEEQRNTLKKAMSRPQTQFILYLTYSVVDTENGDMVTRAIDFINKKAKEKHIQAAKEKARIEALTAVDQFGFPIYTSKRVPTAKSNEDQSLRPDSAISAATGQTIVTSTPKLEKIQEGELLMDSDGIIDTTNPTDPQQFSEKTNVDTLNGVTELPESSSESFPPSSEREPTETGSETDEALRIKSAKQMAESVTLTVSDEDYSNIEVPLTDQFEVVDVPDVCENRDKCLDFKELGCYLALIKRKEVVQLDSKYLIKIAEMRGIFGDKDAPKKPKSKSQKKAEKEAEKAREAALAAERLKRMRHRGSNLVLLIDRLNAPTIASIKRSHHERISNALKRMLFFQGETICQRHTCRHSDYDPESGYLSSYPSGERPPRAWEWWKQTMKYLRKIKLLIMNHENLKLADLVHEGATRDFMSPLRLDRQVYFSSPTKNQRGRTKRAEYPMATNLLQFRATHRSEDK